jgi:xanthosine utilization system XapX-like protein
LVICGDPLKSTLELLTKFVPFTVNVNCGPPAVVLVGDSDVAVGPGLLMTKLTDADAPVVGAGFVTLTNAVPGAVRSDASIAAVICVELTKVVVLLLPLKSTTAPLMKFVPFTVNVNAAPPTVALDGESDVIVGTGLKIWNTCAELVPPPGAGLVAVTLIFPVAASCAPGIVIVSVFPPFETVPPVSPNAPKFTIDPVMKFVPVSVKFTGCPRIPFVGEIEVSVGTGLGALEIVNAKLAVVPPPGAAFVTVTFAVPTEAISLAKIAAVNCVVLTNVVVRAFPLNFTCDPLTYPVPFTVKVNAAPPTVAPLGLSDVIVGTGLFTVNVDPADVPPPGAGFVTVTEGMPATAMSAAVIAAVICVELTKVVVLAAPLKFTAEVGKKFVPFTVNVKAAPPAVALDGDSDVIVAVGLFIVNVWFPDVPPPGAGLKTDTFTVPPVAISVAGTVTCSCVAVCEVGVSCGLAPKLTSEPAMKFVPVSVRVNAAPPAVALVGLIEVSVGAGFAALAVKVRWKSVVPPSPGNADTMKKYCVPDVAANDTCDCAIPVVALTLQATCVPFAVPLVTFRIVS